MRRILKNMLGSPGGESVDGSADWADGRFDDEEWDDEQLDDRQWGDDQWGDDQWRDDQWDDGQWVDEPRYEPGGFDAVLSRELLTPTVEVEPARDDNPAGYDIERSGGATGQSDIEPSPNYRPRASSPRPRQPRPHPDAIATTVDSTAAENDRLRAEMLPGPSLTAPTRAWADHTPPPPSIPAPSPTLEARTRPDLPVGLVAPTPSADAAGFFPNPESGPDSGFDPDPDFNSDPGFNPDLDSDPVGDIDSVGVVGAAARPEPAVDLRQLEFWDRYDDAAASAELFAPPAAAVAVVIGSMPATLAVARRCQVDHWVGACDVFVLTDRDDLVDDPSWTILQRPSDVVSVLEGGDSDFPLIVIDVADDLPAWIRPLMVRLRSNGVGLVRYVLDGDPSDEDLATWHGELGRPSVLDLAGYVAPERVVELLDRGEPVVSVAGVPISTELLLSLRLAATG
jgi:hypothetical protein